MIICSHGRAVEDGNSKCFGGRLPFPTFHKLLKFLWEKDHLKIKVHALLTEWDCAGILQPALRYLNY